MKYFLRLTIAPIVYFLSTAFIVIGVQAFPTLSPAVRIILNSIFIGLYILCTFVVMRKEGELAFNKLLLNDLSRRKLLETGEDVEIKTTEEYRPYKGFIVGLICVIPLIILVVLHLIVRVPGEISDMGVYAEMFYSPIYSFFGHYKNATESSLYWGLLIYLVFLPTSLGIPYIVGAMKRRKQDQDIAETNRKIHGDK